MPPPTHTQATCIRTNTTSHGTMLYSTESETHRCPPTDGNCGDTGGSGRPRRSLDVVYISKTRGGGVSCRATCAWASRLADVDGINTWPRTPHRTHENRDTLGNKYMPTLQRPRPFVQTQHQLFNTQVDRSQNSPRRPNLFELIISLKLCEVDSLTVRDVLR